MIVLSAFEAFLVDMLKIKIIICISSESEFCTFWYFNILPSMINWKLEFCMTKWIIREYIYENFLTI